MLITFISDTHFNNPHRFSSTTSRGYNSRFIDQLSVFSLIPEQTEVLLHIGDVFHNKFRLETQLYDKVYSSFESAPGRRKILVGGNHDFSSFWREPTMYPFRRICDLVTQRYEYIDVHNEYKTVRFHCIPYPDFPSVVFESIDMAIGNLAEFNILVAHLGIDEAVIGPTDRRLKSDVYLSDLQPNKFDYVFLGHYHKHQQLADNVWYVGSPLQHDFGERGENKGIMTLNVETGSVRFIENVVVPKFRVFEVKNERELAKLDLNRKDFYKIYLKGKFVKSILDETAEGKNIIYEGGVTEERETRLAPDAKDIIKEYITLTAPKELDTQELEKVGRSYL